MCSFLDLCFTVRHRRGLEESQKASVQYSALYPTIASYAFQLMTDYAVKQDRLWRKNRMRYNESISFSQLYNESCIGVDLNRNFNFQWGTGI